MGTVVQEQDVRDAGLPVCVQDALGELVSDARQGLLALSVRGWPWGAARALSARGRGDRGPEG